MRPPGWHRHQAVSTLSTCACFTPPSHTVHSTALPARPPGCALPASQPYLRRREAAGLVQLPRSALPPLLLHRHSSCRQVRVVGGGGGPRRHAPFARMWSPWSFQGGGALQHWAGWVGGRAWAQVGLFLARGRLITRPCILHRAPSPLQGGHHFRCPLGWKGVRRGRREGQWNARAAAATAEGAAPAARVPARAGVNSSQQR